MTSLQTESPAAPTDPAPAPSRARRRRGPLRRGWARLTSMRTALLLLFLLALAAVPGSFFPQRGANPLAVDAYIEAHPTLAPVLDRLSMFDVYASPWFAAVYLLLFVSLVGCLVPRVRHHVAELRRPPPRAPRHLDRLPSHAAWPMPSDPGATGSDERPDPPDHPERPGADASAEALGDATGRWLRRHRWRTVVSADAGVVSVAAEKGYLRETGNLVFHVSLGLLLVGLGVGAYGGWQGTLLVEEGETACATATQFDRFAAGAGVTPGDVPPLCLTLHDFTATYLPSGQPTDFVAEVSYTEGDATAPATPFTLSVNNPLRLGGTRVYLVNHGFSPVVTVTDPSGQVFSRIRAPFLPQDAAFTSEGVFKLPDAQPEQYGFQGFFLPTRPDSGPPIRSVSPIPDAPGLTLLAYGGDLGLDSGEPQSVYSLDPDQISSGALTRIDSAALVPGETWALPDGSTLRFEGYDEWVTLHVAQDPGQLLVLGAAAALVVGLVTSLRVRRRRVWVRFRPSDATVQMGGIARTDSDRFAREFVSLASVLATEVTAQKVERKP